MHVNCTGSSNVAGGISSGEAPPNGNRSGKLWAPKFGGPSSPPLPLPFVVMHTKCMVVYNKGFVEALCWDAAGPVRHRDAAGLFCARSGLSRRPRPAGGGRRCRKRQVAGKHPQIGPQPNRATFRPIYPATLEEPVWNRSTRRTPDHPQQMIPKRRSRTRMPS